MYLLIVQGTVIVLRPRIAPSHGDDLPDAAPPHYRLIIFRPSLDGPAAVQLDPDASAPFLRAGNRNNVVGVDTTAADVNHMRHSALLSFLSVHHRENFPFPQPHLMVQEFLDIEGVTLVIIGRVLIIGMLRQVVLVRKKRPHAPQLQDALAAVHHGKLIHRGKVLSQLLIIHPVGRAAPSGLGGAEHIYGLLPQSGVQLLQRGRLRAAQEELGVHVPHDGVRIVLVDGLQLAPRLQHQTAGYLTAPDGGHQLLKIRDLPDVGRLVDQAAHMDRQPSPINVIRLLAQQIEQLGVHHGDQEIERGVRVAHDQEQRRLSVPQRVQLQLVIGRDVPQLLNVEGRQPCAAADKDGLGRLASDVL